MVALKRPNHYKQALFCEFSHRVRRHDRCWPLCQYHATNLTKNDNYFWIWTFWVSTKLADLTKVSNFGSPIPKNFSFLLLFLKKFFRKILEMHRPHWRDKSNALSPGILDFSDSSQGSGLLTRFCRQPFGIDQGYRHDSFEQNADTENFSFRTR